jgi:hypothetical protein
LAGLTDIERHTANTDLVVTHDVAEQLVNRFSDSPTMDQSDRNLLWILQRSIEIELKHRLFLSLSPDEAKYYEQTQPLFGAEVQDTFPEIQVDVEEAGKCLALGRYTACVFHLMRVMELGVQRFGRELGVEERLTRENPWGTILNAVNGKLKERYEGNQDQKMTAERKAERDSHAETIVYLRNVKNAWRNPTMHPAATYTEEQAKQIFDSVRAFICDFTKKS